MPVSITMIPAVSTSAHHGPSVTSVINTGGIIAMTEPRLGMKLRTKKSRPHAKASGTPSSHMNVPSMTPDIRLISVCVSRYWRSFCETARLVSTIRRARSSEKAACVFSPHCRASVSSIAVKKKISVRKPSSV